MQTKSPLLAVVLGTALLVGAGARATSLPSIGPAALEEKSFACGSKGQPLCPLQSWMRSNLSVAASSNDAPALAKALDHLAQHAPEGMAEWSKIAEGGAAKAKQGDAFGAKESCLSCHDAYKARYKAELRDRPF